MSKLNTIIPVMAFALLLSCTPLSDEANKTVRAPKATSQITIDGKADEPCWEKAEAFNFNHFYRIEKPTDEQKTSFKVLWDEENIYLFYACEDKYITARMKDRDGWTFVDDCAEIFLSPVPEQIGMHFGFETNLYKATNDFVFINNVYQEKNFVVKAYNPDFEVEVTIDGTVNDNSDIDKGWIMEMAIPRATFNTAGPVVPIEEGARWTFLALRQDRNEVEGQRVATSTLFPMPNDYKDVHKPESFGVLEFVGE